ncbi:hypothetical protein IWW36_005859, partial [Coemansia brasiliensis]
MLRPNQSGQQVQDIGKPHRPTYIGIHTRDDATNVLYVSSGIREALGYTPEQLMSKPATSFIADECPTDYPLIYNRESQEEEEDEADVHSLFLNVKHANGTTVLERVTSIKCSNCVIVVAMAFPEIIGQRQKELQVEMLNGAMKR